MRTDWRDFTLMAISCAMLQPTTLWQTKPFHPPQLKKIPLFFLILWFIHLTRQWRPVASTLTTRSNTLYRNAAISRHHQQWTNWHHRTSIVLYWTPLPSSRQPPYPPLYTHHDQSKLIIKLHLFNSRMVNAVREEKCVKLNLTDNKGHRQCTALCCLL